MITNTGIILDPEKRADIAKIKFKGVSTYIVTKEGNLSVLHDDAEVIDIQALTQAVDSFIPEKRKSEEVGKKKDQDITLREVVEVLREKGILEKGGV